MTFTTTTETSPSKPPSRNGASRLVALRGGERALRGRDRTQEMGGRGGAVTSHGDGSLRARERGWDTLPHLTCRSNLHLFLYLFFFSLQKTVSLHLILESSCFSPVFLFFSFLFSRFYQG